MVNEMAQAGVVFGHKKSKTHPRMKQFIGANRNELELIDPTAVFSSISNAIEFLKDKVSNGGVILLAGTTSPAKGAVEQFAKRFSFPFVTNRWLGGTLTNFKMISSQMRRYEEMKARSAEELSKYTKKERLELSKEISSMSRSFDGLMPLRKLPDALFVVDIESHDTAVREAHKLHIPIVAILDTNDDPKSVDYPIFASDHGRESIEWVFGKICEEIKNLPAKQDVVSIQ